MWEQLDSGRVRHRFEHVVLALTVLVVPVLIVELAGVTGPWRTAATVADWIIWGAFATEVLVIAVVADDRRRALRAHWLDVAIVLVTAPMLPTVLASLRLARVVRLLRVMRLVLLAWRALVVERRLDTRHGLRVAAVATVVLVALAGVAVTYTDPERFRSPWLGVWWAITTVTTVGYGDAVPVSAIGRVIASGVMIVGIGFLSFLTAAVASHFVAVDDQSVHARDGELVAVARRIEERLDTLEAAVRDLAQPR